MFLSRGLQRWKKFFVTSIQEEAWTFKTASLHIALFSAHLSSLMFHLFTHRWETDPFRTGASFAFLRSLEINKQSARSEEATRGLPDTEERSQSHLREANIINYKTCLTHFGLLLQGQKDWERTTGHTPIVEASSISPLLSSFHSPCCSPCCLFYCVQFLSRSFCCFIHLYMDKVFFPSYFFSISQIGIVCFLAFLNSFFCSSFFFFCFGFRLTSPGKSWLLLLIKWSLFVWIYLLDGNSGFPIKLELPCSFSNVFPDFFFHLCHKTPLSLPFSFSCLPPLLLPHFSHPFPPSPANYPAKPSQL